MLITQSQAEILKVFVGKITDSFTLREIGRILKMHVSQTHKAIKPLIDNKIIKLDKHKHLYLDYKENHEILAYVEYLKRDEFLNKSSKNKTISLFMEDVTKKIGEESFVLLIFGSAVEKNNPRDIDVLLIVDNIKRVDSNEKFLHNMAFNYDLPFEERVISFESVYEMLAKRDEKNIMNEILNKHIILQGAELFYKLVKKGRL